MDLEPHDGRDDGAEEPVSDALADRRKVIKRAAAGAAVAGAAWMAPRVQGLSLLPDFAAASTLAGTVTTSHSFLWVRAWVWDSGGWYDSSQDDREYPGTDHWAVGPTSAGRDGAPGDTFVNAATSTQAVPTLPGANLTVQIPQGTAADAGVGVPVNVTFSGFDPPFNRMNGVTLNYNTRGPGNSTSQYGPYPAPSAPLGTFPRSTDSPFSFTLPQALNDLGASPEDQQQWWGLNFTFSFGPA